MSASAEALEVEGVVETATAVHWCCVARKISPKPLWSRQSNPLVVPRVVASPHFGFARRAQRYARVLVGPA